jgi:hypothetical protein
VEPPQSLVDQIQLFHDSTSQCLFGLVRFQSFLNEHFSIGPDERRAIPARQLFLDHISPLFEAHGKIHNVGSPSDRFVAARIELGRGPLTFGSLSAPSAHVFVHAITIIVIQLWNRAVNPGEVEPRPIFGNESFEFRLRAPSEEWDTTEVATQLYHFFMGRDILNLHVELTLEFSKAISMLDANPPPSPPKPLWDSVRRELSLDGKVCKKYRQPARNQERILAAFQEEDWEKRIDDPLPGGAEDARQRLADTIRSLNKGNDLIQFELDGTSEGVLWKLKTP